MGTYARVTVTDDTGGQATVVCSSDGHRLGEVLVDCAEHWKNKRNDDDPESPPGTAAEFAETLCGDHYGRQHNGEVVGDGAFGSQEYEYAVRLAAFAAALRAGADIARVGTYEPRWTVYIGGDGTDRPDDRARERACWYAAIDRHRQRADKVEAQLAEVIAERDAYGDTLAGIRDATGDDLATRGVSAQIVAGMVLKERGYLPFGRTKRAEAAWADAEDELHRVRPVIEAACAWRAMRSEAANVKPKPEAAALIAAVDAYLAVQDPDVPDQT